jgi:hypothetical protein
MVFGLDLDIETIVQVLGGLGGLVTLFRFGPKVYRWCARIAIANWRAEKLQEQVSFLERQNKQLIEKSSPCEKETAFERRYRKRGRIR